MGRKKKNQPANLFPHQDPKVSSKDAGGIKEVMTVGCACDFLNPEHHVHQSTSKRTGSSLKLSSTFNVLVPSLNMEAAEDEGNNAMETEPILTKCAYLEGLGSSLSHINTGTTNASLGHPSCTEGMSTLEFMLPNPSISILGGDLCEESQSSITCVDKELGVRLSPASGKFGVNGCCEKDSGKLLAEEFFISSDQELVTGLESLASSQELRASFAKPVTAVGAHVDSVGSSNHQQASSWHIVSNATSYEPNIGTVYLDLRSETADCFVNHVMQSRAVMLRYGCSSSNDHDQNISLSTDLLGNELHLNVDCKELLAALDNGSMSRAVDSMLATVNTMIRGSHPENDDPENDVPHSENNHFVSFESSSGEVQETSSPEDEKLFAKDLIHVVLENAKQALLEDLRIGPKTPPEGDSLQLPGRNIDEFAKQSLYYPVPCPPKGSITLDSDMHVTVKGWDSILLEEAECAEKVLKSNKVKASAIFDSIFCDSFLLTDKLHGKLEATNVIKKNPSRILMCSPRKTKVSSTLPCVCSSDKESMKQQSGSSELDNLWSGMISAEETVNVDGKESGIICDICTTSSVSEELLCIKSSDEVCKLDIETSGKSANPSTTGMQVNLAGMDMNNGNLHGSAWRCESGFSEETSVLSVLATDLNKPPGLLKMNPPSGIFDSQTSAKCECPFTCECPKMFHLDHGLTAQDVTSAGHLVAKISSERTSGDVFEQSCSGLNCSSKRHGEVKESVISTLGDLTTSLCAVPSSFSDDLSADTTLSDSINTPAPRPKKKKKKSNKAPTAGSHISELNKDVKCKPVAGAGQSVAERKRVQKLVEEVAKLGDGFLLFDEEASFESSRASFCDTGKQILALQIVLECPGIVKSALSETRSSLIDENSSDVFIGLISLFVLLLHGNASGITLLVPYIPFDVVSLQQVFLDDQLTLLVGVTENTNTLKLKARKSKSSKSFFQTLTHFLNVTTLEKLLADIWQVTEERQVRERLRALSNVWDQLQFQASVCVNTIPGSGKLSSFITVNPDANALTRMLNVCPALLPHVDESQASAMAKDSCLWFHGHPIHAEYTCLTVQNLLSVSPKNIAWLLLRLREEAVEICGLRVCYIGNDNGEPEAELAIALKEVRACSIEEGNLLLSMGADDAGSMATNFLREDSPSKQSGVPVVNYAINASLSRRGLVSWFGPRYDSIAELEMALLEAKTWVALGGRVKSVKSYDGPDLSSCRRLNLVNHHNSFGMLLVAQHIPSTFLSIVISAAEKKGLVLRTIFKSSAGASILQALGVPDSQVVAFSSLSAEDTVSPALSSSTCCTFTLLVFDGRSVSARLIGLVRKLSSILSNTITGETVSDWLADKSFKYRRSHNYRGSNDVVIGTRSRKSFIKHARDYFVALHLNERTKDLVSSHHLPGTLSMHHVFCRLPQVNLLIRRQPELCLAFVALAGQQLISAFPGTLKALLSPFVFECLSSWQKSAGSLKAAVGHESLVELLGLKYLPNLSEQILRDHLQEPISGGCSCSLEKGLVGAPALIFVLRLQNSKMMADVRNRLEHIAQSVMNDTSPCQVFFHKDSFYVFRLLTTFFLSRELHGDISTCRAQTWPLYLAHDYWLLKEAHPNLDISPLIVAKRTLPPILWSATLPKGYVPVSETYYEVHSIDFSVPGELILPEQPSYCGVSMLYEADQECRIVKAISRMLRFGCVIAGLVFPVFGLNGSCYMNLVLKRVGAIALINKIVPDLEDDYGLNIKVSRTARDAIMFIREEFCASEGENRGGGIFYPTTAVLLQDLFFREEKAFCSGSQRDLIVDPKAARVLNCGE